MEPKFPAIINRHSGQAGESFSLRLIRLQRKRDPESRNVVGACGTRPLWMPVVTGMTAIRSVIYSTDYGSGTLAGR